jgi:hypothetical protein
MAVPDVSREASASGQTNSAAPHEGGVIDLLARRLYAAAQEGNLGPDTVVILSIEEPVAANGQTIATLKEEHARLKREVQACQKFCAQRSRKIQQLQMRIWQMSKGQPSPVQIEQDRVRLAALRFFLLPFATQCLVQWEIKGEVPEGLENEAPTELADDGMLSKVVVVRCLAEWQAEIKVLENRIAEAQLLEELKGELAQLEQEEQAYQDLVLQLQSVGQALDQKCAAQRKARKSENKIQKALTIEKARQVAREIDSEPEGADKERMKREFAGTLSLITGVPFPSAQTNVAQRSPQSGREAPEAALRPQESKKGRR